MFRIAWAILRPQLEETIRLRRDKIFRIARSSCISSRKQAILGFARSLAMSNEAKLLLLHDELLELPDVSNIINADGLHETVSEGDMQIVKTCALDFGTKRFQEEADLCGAAMLLAFAECGLISSDERVSDCDQDKTSRSFSKADSNVLEHCCALFKYTNMPYRPQTTFSVLLSDHQPWGSGHLVAKCTPDARAILIAKQLAKDLDVLHLTTSDLDLLKDCFVCARCDPIFRKKLDWGGLVRCSCSQVVDMLIKPCP